MKHGRTLTLSMRNNIIGWLFVLPFILGVIFFFLFPLIEIIRYSFSAVSLEIGYYRIEYVGIQNYYYIFREDQIYIWNFLGSLTQLLYGAPVIIISSLFFAVLLNRKFKGRTFSRAVFFLPVIVASGAVIQILKNDIVSSTIMAGNAQTLAMQDTLFNSSGLQDLLINSGLNPAIINYFVSISNQIFSLMWQTGIQMLIFLAGLQSIPSSLYEASAVEGASAWENFWMITVPMLGPIMLVNIVYTIVDSFTNLDNPVMKQIYGQSNDQRYGISSAMSIPYLLAVALILVGILLIYRRISSSDGHIGR